MRHVLDQRMRLVLARMEVFLSYGTTQAFDKSGGRVKATGGQRPSGDSSPVHELFRAMYNRAGTNEQRKNVCEAAEDEWGKLTQQARPALVEPGSIHWKREIAESDEPYERIKDLYGISRQTWWNYRRDYRK